VWFLYRGNILDVVFFEGIVILALKNEAPCGTVFDPEFSLPCGDLTAGADRWEVMCKGYASISACEDGAPIERRFYAYEDALGAVEDGVYPFR
jgi:hypothetical protein